jgi:hypothetical protein
LGVTTVKFTAVEDKTVRATPTKVTNAKTTIVKTVNNYKPSP